MMARALTRITLVVREYDEAIRFYTEYLDFTLVEDTDLGNGKRWVRVRAGDGAELLMAKAVTPEQESRIGNQTGGRVFLFLETDDFDRDYDLYRSRGVTFLETPREEPYGKVVVMADLYGNKIDVIAHRADDRDSCNGIVSAALDLPR